MFVLHMLGIFSGRDSRSSPGWCPIFNMNTFFTEKSTTFSLLHQQILKSIYFYIIISLN